MHAHLLKQDVHAYVAVELLDLAVFHDPEVSAGNIEFGSVRLKDAGRRLVWPGEGASDRQLDRNDVVLNDHPMELTVNVGSELGQEHHEPAQLDAYAMLATGRVVVSAEEGPGLIESVFGAVERGAPTRAPGGRPGSTA